MENRQRIQSVIVAVLFTLFLVICPVSPVFGSAVIYSAEGDFSTTNGNPNGVWSYGWMPKDFSSFNLLPYHSSHEWYGWGNDRTPSVWLNTGNMAYGVPSGWLSLHPGNGAEPAVLRWSAPDAGTVYVVGQFLPGDGGVMTVAVRHNNVTLWSATDFGSFYLMVDVATGDTIDFAVYGGYGAGNTPLRAAITPPPSPPVRELSSILLAGLGVLALGGFIWLRKGRKSCPEW